MSFYGTSQTKKKRTKRITTAARKMTTGTKATRSEHGTASIWYNETAFEENKSGGAGPTLDRRHQRYPSCAYPRCQQTGCEVGRLSRRHEGWRQDRNSIPPKSGTIPNRVDHCLRRLSGKTNRC